MLAKENPARSGLNCATKFTKFTIFCDSLAKTAKFAKLTVFRDDLVKTTNYEYMKIIYVNCGVKKKIIKLQH